MDSAGDTVLQLQVHLGDGVVGEDGGVRDITCDSKLELVQCSRPIFHSAFFSFCVQFEGSSRICVVRLGRRTDSSGLNHVADGESLDRLVLGGASRAVGAADGLDVAAALLVTSAVKREKELVSLSSFHWNSQGIFRLPERSSMSFSSNCHRATETTFECAGPDCWKGEIAYFDALFLTILTDFCATRQTGKEVSGGRLSRTWLVGCGCRWHSGLS